MGAWIEIYLAGEGASARLVAPYMGAWIEITTGCSKNSSKIVAPYMGAWIEIDRATITILSLVVPLHGSVD